MKKKVGSKKKVSGSKKKNVRGSERKLIEKKKDCRSKKKLEV